MLTRYFPPDIGTSANLFFDLACSLKKAGHEVTVVTGYPWYNLKAIPLEYRTGIFRMESHSGINILRVRMPLFRSVKMNLASGHVLAPVALLIGGLRCAKAEAIYAYSPPLLIGLAGKLIAWKMKAILVLGVQDLHPQAYIDQEIIKNRVLIKIFRVVERYVYRLCDAITVHSDGNKDHVSSVLGARKVCVKVVPNWIDSTAVVPLPRLNSFSEQLNLHKKFVVGYAGTIGLSQGAKFIIDVASFLKEKSEIHFLLVGDGIEKDSIRRQAQEEGLDNITFLDMQPQEVYPYIVATFDVGLVTLNAMVKTPVIPSKIISIMAAGRSFVASLPEGDAADLVRVSNSGLVVPPESSNELKAALLHLYDHPDVRKRLGENGRRYVEGNLTADTAAATIQEICQITKKRGKETKLQS